MPNDNLIQAIKDKFLVKDLLDLWPDIQMTYEALNFEGPENDALMCDEYKYISDQLFKYIATKQEPILSKIEKLDDMLAEVESCITSSRIAKPKDPDRHIRTAYVYARMRNDWLWRLKTLITMCIDCREEQQDEWE